MKANKKTIAVPARNKATIVAIFVALCVAAIVAFGTGTLANAATEAAYYAQKSDPDATYASPSYTGAIDSADKATPTSEGAEVNLLQDANGQPTDGKDAIWTSKDKSTLDIAISYHDKLADIVFLQSMCSAHDLKQTDTVAGELAAAAELSDVKAYFEGTFLFDQYNYPLGSDSTRQAYTGSSPNVYKVLNPSFTVDINKGTSAGVALTEINTQHAPYNQTYNSDVLKSGQHANVFSFARVVKNELGNLADEDKPDTIVISFDAWAWAVAGLSLESPDWKDDMQLMMDAAAILKEYYDDGKVIWLVPPDTVSGNSLMPLSQYILNKNNNRSLRETYSNFLYPDDVNDFLVTPTPIDRNEYYITNDSSFATKLYGTKGQKDANGNSIKKTIAWDWRAGNLVKQDANNDGQADSGSWGGYNAQLINYYTLSKRIVLYQFALLNPEKFMQVMNNADWENWDLNDPTSYPNDALPGINDWLAGTSVPTTSYGSVSDVRTSLRNNYKGYDKYVVNDTLAVGLTYDSADVYYLDDSDENNPVWKNITGDGVDVANSGQDVTATITDSRAIGKRVKLVIHAKVNEPYFVNDNDGTPKDTNVGQATAEAVLTGGNTDDSDKVQNTKTFASPQLRKVPETATVSVFKKWDDSENQDGMRQEVANTNLLVKDAGGQFVKAKDINGIEVNPGVVPAQDGLVITWTDIPVKNLSSIEDDLTYKISEDLKGLAGYYTEYSIVPTEFTLKAGENKEIVVTNKATPKTKKIKIEKVWNDQADKENLRPEKVTVVLKKEYKLIQTETEKGDKEVTVNSQSKFAVRKITSDGTEYYQAGNKYYRGDTVDVTNGEVKDNESLLVFTPDNTDAPVQVIKPYFIDGYPVKVNSQGDEYYIKGGRTYLADGTDVTSSPTFTRSKNDDQVSKTEQQKVEDNGTEYGVKQTADGVKYYEKDGKYYNTYKEELSVFAPSDEDQVVTIDVIKAPIYTDETTEEEIELTADDNWQTELTEDENTPEGQAIKYSVFEKDVPSGYTAAVTSTKANEFTVTNTHVVPKYTITYDANGGSGTMEDDNYQGGDSTMPSKENTFTREGYTFTGFIAYDENGNELFDGKVFKSAEEFADYFKDKPNGTKVKLVAQWEKVETSKTHWVTYVDPDGTVYTVKTNYKDKDTEIPAPTPTKEGYTFAGWDRSEDADGNVTYVAKWEPIKKEQPKKDTPNATPETGDSLPLLPTLGILAFVTAGVRFMRRAG